MKKLILVAVGMFFLLTVVSVNAIAQVTATGHITAEVIDAITATESSPLNIQPLLSDKSIKSASFSVSGAKDATFTVTLPDGPTKLTSLSGVNDLMITGWTASSEHGNVDYILAGGTEKIMVGATLTVNGIESNPKGIYTGSYQVTFAYN